MPNSSRELLDAAYSRLGFEEGDLQSAADHPTDATTEGWVDKGDWLTLAMKVGAEKVFFVNSYPVIVFAEQKSEDPSEWFRWFNSIWCMARPQLLFLAREGELSVLNLTKRPARRGEERNRDDRLLDVVRATADVQDHLSRYRREQVESGRLFENRRFGSGDRADRALIRDLGKVRAGLIEAGLPAAYAHSLIGRSIFIRYLEDREVLTEEYFKKVARGDKVRWNEVLDRDTDVERAAGGGRPVYYPRVLNNKAFTYALFARLSKDFNGDMFPVNNEEERAVTEKHLRLLRRFLLADTDENLFFFAYRFDIIPIELISSIYETFYSTEPDQQRDDASYYTPAALVDFVLSQTLDDVQLAKRPRVMDPACGSGIFLVEVFRRIVRYQVGQLRRNLRPDELRAILRDQIAGVDINPEAVRVAAFSLYLALLHYLKPPDILQNRLPFLTYETRTKTDPQKHFDILLAGDSFRVEDTIPAEAVRKKFTSGCADIVVGNPPWGSPEGNIPENVRSDGGVAWCKKRALAVGDKERSQSFIHRTMDLLRDGGRAGLLVSTGVFYKCHNNTKLFREQWLSNVTLRQVINFAAVRDAFFSSGAEGGRRQEEVEEKRKGGIAPFAAVVFDKIKPDQNSWFAYWSAKETAFVKQVQAVVLNRADFCHAHQEAFLKDEALWKIYWWGTHRDEALVRRLRLERTLQQIFDPENDRLQTGFKEVTRDTASGWLRKFKEFPARLFHRYGPLPVDRFVAPPSHVERRRERSLYEGPRLLIKRGVGSDEVATGRIAARFETAPFCFRHSIYGLTMPEADEMTAKVALGILWSSLTRYYLFMTTGTWGLWHDEVLKQPLSALPIRLPTTKRMGERIIKIVDSLRAIPDPVETDTFFTDGGLSVRQRVARIRDLEAMLDQAIYDLFELSEGERERVVELCSLGLDLYYRGINSEAVQPLDWPDHLPTFGHSDDLSADTVTGNELVRYLKTYLQLWEPHLRPQSGRLRWRVVRPQGASPMMAVLFQTEGKEEDLAPPTDTDERAWVEILDRLEKSSRQEKRAQRVYVDGLVRIVTETDIVIAKRNERRLWTGSAARDDAEATMLLALQLPTGNGS